MPSREEMLKELFQLQQEFSRLVRNIDQEDLAFATASARNVANRMDAIIRAVETQFADDFRNNRLNRLADDLLVIQKFETTPPTRRDLNELSRVAAHLSRDVRSIETLIHLVYPRPAFSIKPLIDKYGRRAAIIGGAVAMISLLVFSYNGYQSKRRGLFGKYHAGSNFETVERERIDGPIDFRWARRPPIRNWRADNFSVRWTGYIRVPFTETWELITFSDDGVRLTLGDKLLIDNWTFHATMRDNVQVKLKEGYYPITIEYFDNTGDASFRLFWQHQGGPSAEAVPASKLSPSARFLKSSIPVIETITPDQIVGGSALPRPAQAPVAQTPPPATPAKK